jgi:hypothetical protein
VGRPFPGTLLRASSGRCAARSPARYTGQVRVLLVLGLARVYLTLGLGIQPGDRLWWRTVYRGVKPETYTREAGVLTPSTCLPRGRTRRGEFRRPRGGASSVCGKRWSFPRACRRPRVGKPRWRRTRRHLHCGGSGHGPAGARRRASGIAWARLSARNRLPRSQLGGSARIRAPHEKESFMWWAGRARSVGGRGDCGGAREATEAGADARSRPGRRPPAAIHRKIPGADL